MKKRALLAELTRLRGYTGELIDAVTDLRRRVARLEEAGETRTLAQRARAAHDAQVAGMDEGDHDFGPAFRRLVGRQEGRPA